MPKHRAVPARKAGNVRLPAIHRRKEKSAGAEAIINKLFDGLQGSQLLPDVSSVSLLVDPPVDQPSLKLESAEPEVVVPASPEPEPTESDEPEPAESAKSEPTDSEPTDATATVEDATATVEDASEEETGEETGEETVKETVKETVNSGLLSDHEQFNYPGVRICTKIKVISVQGERVIMSDKDRGNVVYPSEKDVARLASAPSEEKENKNLRRFKDTLRKNNIVLEELGKFKKVVLMIQKAKYSILPARVVRVQNTKLYLIWGNMSPEEDPKPELDVNNMAGELADLDDEDAPELVPNELDFEEIAGDTNNANGDLPTADATMPLVPEKEIEIPDDAIFTPNDVSIVMDQTECTQQEAVQALSAEKGDLVAAVLRLT